MPADPVSPEPLPLFHRAKSHYLFSGESTSSYCCCRPALESRVLWSALQSLSSDNQALMNADKWRHNRQRQQTSQDFSSKQAKILSKALFKSCRHNGIIIIITQWAAQVHSLTSCSSRLLPSSCFGHMHSLFTKSRQKGNFRNRGDRPVWYNLWVSTVDLGLAFEEQSRWRRRFGLLSSRWIG